MTRERDKGVQGTPEAVGAGARDAERPDRRARAAEQLRANLQRRKQQARARRAGEADDRSGLASDDP